MILRLYDFSKKVKSTKQVTNESYAEYNIVFKASTSLTEPTFRIDTGGVYPTSTYAALLIPVSENVTKTYYYFINDIVSVSNNIFEIVCSIDPLATTKADILNTTTFVIYSASNYNRWLKDDRTPIIIKDSEYITSTSTIVIGENSVFEASDNETVLITTVSENEGIGTWITNESGLSSIMAALSENDTIFEALSKQFGDAMGSIIQCIRLPINAANFSNDGELQIMLGKYGLTYGGQPVTRQKTSTRHLHANGSIGIPLTYTDYRFTEPYCKAKLSLPFVGTMDFPLSELAPSGGLNWRCDIDVLTGLVQYAIFDTTATKMVASYSGNCGGMVPLAATQLSNVSNVVGGLTSGLASAGLSLATGNILPALVGGISASAQGFYGMQQSSTSVIGSFSGGRSEFTNRSIKLTVEKFPTACEPSDLTAIEGRPLMNTVSLSTLTGYVRTQNFQLEASWPKAIKDRVNSLLDSGIYIE